MGKRHHPPQGDHKTRLPTLLRVPRRGQNQSWLSTFHPNALTLSGQLNRPPRGRAQLARGHRLSLPGPWRWAWLRGRAEEAGRLRSPLGARLLEEASVDLIFS